MTRAGPLHFLRAIAGGGQVASLAGVGASAFPATVLILASVLKAMSLFVDVSSNSFIGRALVSGICVIELVVGVALLLGRRWFWPRYIALGLFSLFCSVSIVNAVRAIESCGCFGGERVRL